MKRRLRLSPGGIEAVAKGDYSPSFDSAIALTEGQRVTITDRADKKWWWVTTTNAQGAEVNGFVPADWLMMPDGKHFEDEKPTQKHLAAEEANKEVIFAWATGGVAGATMDLAAKNKLDRLRGHRDIQEAEWAKMCTKGGSYRIDVDPKVGLTKVQWFRHGRSGGAPEAAEVAVLVRARLTAEKAAEEKAAREKAAPAEAEAAKAQAAKADAEAAKAQAEAATAALLAAQQQAAPEPELSSVAPQGDLGAPPARAAPKPSADDPFAAELATMKGSALKKSAKALGATPDQMDDVDDADDIKAAAIALILSLRGELEKMKLSALKKKVRALGASEEQMDELDDADDPKAVAVQLILQIQMPGGGAPMSPAGAAAAGGAEPEPEEEAQESHGRDAPDAAEPEHFDFDLVFSNKTASDALCLAVRGQLVSRGLAVWQQTTNIPKDSDNCEF